VLPGIRLDIPLLDRVFDQGRGFTSRKRQHFHTREFVEMFPDLADLLTVIGTTRNPDRSMVC
jgi:hypothetical protein